MSETGLASVRRNPVLDTHCLFDGTGVRTAGKSLNGTFIRTENWLKPPQNKSRHQHRSDWLYSGAGFIAQQLAIQKRSRRELAV